MTCSVASRAKHWRWVIVASVKGCTSLGCQSRLADQGLLKFLWWISRPGNFHRSPWCYCALPIWISDRTSWTGCVYYRKCYVSSWLINYTFLQVRINTVLQWQVFSPVPFSEYHPDIVYQDLERPKELDINKKYGHYDVNSARHISFYLKDYMTGKHHFLSLFFMFWIFLYLINLARRKVEQQMPIIKADRDLPAPSVSQPYSSIYSLFVQKMEEIHVLRAVEPVLRLWYDDTPCEPNSDTDQFQTCQIAKAKGMGTRAHLAGLILQYVQSKTL